MIESIIEGKDLIDSVEDFEVILLGTSTYNMLCSGFQKELKEKYPKIEEANNTTKYGDNSKLGKRITVDCDSLIISLMYICTYPNTKFETIDYEALRNCLLTANAEFYGKKCACTILGSSKYDGKGDKEKCLSIIEECTTDLKLTIFDFSQEKEMILGKRRRYKFYYGRRFGL